MYVAYAYYILEYLRVIVFILRKFGGTYMCCVYILDFFFFFALKSLGVSVIFFESMFVCMFIVYILCCRI